MTKGVTAVDRALSIIAAFSNGDRTLSLQSLADRTGLNKSTIVRLIVSLERASFIVRRAKGEYALGPATLRYGSLYQNSLQLSDHALTALSGLRNETGQTAAFFVRDGNSRVCLHMVESYSVLRVHLRVGSVEPILPGGSGRILLAFSNDPEEAAPYAAVRKDFVAMNRGERHPDISSLATPVFGPAGSLLGAMTVSGPTNEYTEERISQFKKCLLKAAEQLTEQLGGTYPEPGHREPSHLPS